jgi:hypothetical protein
VDSVHHESEHGVEELLYLLGITVGEQLHRALDVGEEDRDLLAFPLKGSLRRQDLLNEMRWRIRVRGGELGGRGSPQWRGAREDP